MSLRPNFESGSMTERRFPPPWTVKKIPGGLRVVDANGRSLVYVYSRCSRRRRLVGVDVGRRKLGFTELGI
jgi:hypothetical protein